MKRSRFVYDRSVTNDMADILAAVRADSTSLVALATLDRVIREFADLAVEYDASFNIEGFTTRARYAYNVMIT